MSLEHNAMIFPLFRRSARPDTISTLYGTIVAQARLPRFYRDYAVPDTVNGRFDLIVLHLALLLDRLAADERLRPLGQGVFDRFCRDMDHNLREMGVGDLKVPKEMRRMGEAFYGRAQAYRAALAAGSDSALADTLCRNIYDGTAPAEAIQMAAYMKAAAGHLERLDTADLAAGHFSFPEPTAVPQPAAARVLIAMDKSEHPWSVPVAVEDVPETGLHMEIEAPEPVRARLAKLAGLRELPRLTASFDLTRQGAGVHIAGRIGANLGQTCVVSLEPMESELDEAVDVSFSPSVTSVPGTAEEGHHAAPDEQEPPEPLIGGQVDLGRARGRVPAARRRPLSAQGRCRVCRPGGRRQRRSAFCGS